jgi:phospholipid/cholesterol/gamma-HCH transport system permease protein
MNATTIAKPMNALGEFFVLSAESLVTLVRRPWAWREILEQIWFVARVSIFPTGLEDVSDLLGGFGAWESANLPW